LADDDDIRAKDPSYESFRRDQLQDSLSNLEALDAGYIEEEVYRGEHRAWHIPLWSCLAVIGVIAAVAWLLLR
jgi:hypothetical protein